MGREENLVRVDIAEEPDAVRLEGDLESRHPQAVDTDALSRL